MRKNSQAIRRLVPLLAVVAVGGLGSGCGGGTALSRTATSPIRLQIPRNLLPGPGLCRIFPADARPAMTRSCDGIENHAPLASTVVYRPEDVREVHVRYMDTNRYGVVYRSDIFDLDSGRLLREINYP